MASRNRDRVGNSFWTMTIIAYLTDNPSEGTSRQNQLLSMISYGDSREDLYKVIHK